MTRERFFQLFSNFLSELRSAGVFERFLLSPDQIPQNSSLPGDYVWFLKTFGAMHLFVRTFSADVVIRSCPYRITTKEYGGLLSIVVDQGATLSVLEDNSGRLIESSSNRMQIIDRGFLEYLWSRIDRAKRIVGSTKWAKILNDTYVFSKADARIAQARKQFHVTLLRITPPFTLVLEIVNGSSIILPWFTLRVYNITVPDHFRGIWVRIGSVMPGSHAVIDYDLSYEKRLASVSHSQIAVTDDPAPTPYLVKTRAYKEFDRDVAQAKASVRPPWLS